MRLTKRQLANLIRYSEGETSEPCVRTVPEEKSIELLEALERDRENVHILYDRLTSSEAPGKYEKEVQTQISSYNRLSGNLLRAYKKVLMTNDELHARWKDIKKSKKRKHFNVIPANAEIDLAESSAEHFAGGINIHKLVWICFFGSFVGVVIEMLWTLIHDGVIESRAGLILGPFNLLYGIGAIALTLALYRFRNRGKWLSFLGGMAAGSLVEYVCSLAQEAVFGSRSWDYSALPFNLNGRICLLYSIYWGILGVLWVKTLYPWMAKWILKIPNHVGKVLSATIIVFFSVNALITVVALLRWSQRIDGIEAVGAFWSFVDKLFPDGIMRIIFPNMVF